MPTKIQGLQEILLRKEKRVGFFENKEEIQANISFLLSWDRLDAKKASLVCSYIDGLNFEDTSNYNALMSQIVKRVVELKNVFKKYLIS